MQIKVTEVKLLHSINYTDGAFKEYRNGETIIVNDEFEVESIKKIENINQIYIEKYKCDDVFLTIKQI